MPPLILTLGFDDRSASVFEAARRRHFPAARNLIPAHLTLFHHLPGAAEAAVAAAVRQACGRTPPFPLDVTGLKFLGRGTAYRLASPVLLRLRADLAALWADDLTAQDAQRFDPHVTIQNKADAARAKALFRALDDTFEPFRVEATGLLLWRYLGGPWEAAGAFPFADASGDGGAR